MSDLSVSNSEVDVITSVEQGVVTNERVACPAVDFFHDVMGQCSGDHGAAVIKQNPQSLLQERHRENLDWLDSICSSPQ